MKTTLIRAANIWAYVATAFLLVGVAAAVAAAIWNAVGLPVCFVPLTVAFVAKQGEARQLRRALDAR